jgi:hypothetical protein
MRMGLNSPRLKEAKAVDSVRSHRPTVAFAPVNNVFIYFGNVINLVASYYTPLYSPYNEPADVVNRFTSYRLNLTGTFIEFFIDEKASFTLTNAGGITILLATSAQETSLPLPSPYDDIILLVNTCIAHWSQSIYNSRMGLNHDGEIDYNDINTFVDSYIGCWKGQS